MSPQHPGIPPGLYRSALLISGALLWPVIVLVQIAPLHIRPPWRPPIGRPLTLLNPSTPEEPPVTTQPLQLPDQAAPVPGPRRTQVRRADPIPCPKRIPWFEFGVA